MTIKKRKSAAQKNADLAELIREVIREDRKEGSERKFIAACSSAAYQARDSVEWSMLVRRGLEYSYKPMEEQASLPVFIDGKVAKKLIDPISGYCYYKSTDGKETIYTSNEKVSIFQRLIRFFSGV